MVALAAPTRANRHIAALLTTGKVSVMRVGGGFGELVIGATQTDVSSSSRWPGKREHVCPSGPTPKRNTHEEHFEIFEVQFRLVLGVEDSSCNLQFLLLNQHNALLHSMTADEAADTSEKSRVKVYGYILIWLRKGGSKSDEVSVIEAECGLLELFLHWHDFVFLCFKSYLDGLDFLTGQTLKFPLLLKLLFGATQQNGFHDGIETLYSLSTLDPYLLIVKWSELQETKETVDIQQFVVHWCACEAPAVGGAQLTHSLGSNSLGIADSVGFVQNDTFPTHREQQTLQR
ncbi:hypothetical protein B566_EDAN012022 [Ephemera danica]|nr:hypothetical protein B566_EDAN012022 [Ephemera danica]